VGVTHTFAKENEEQPRGFPKRISGTYFRNSK